MSRSLLILNSPNVRARAKTWIDAAPHNTAIEFREAKRSISANAKMWASLTDVSKQVLHFGRQYPPEIWKLLMMHALGQEMKFIPALDGTTVVPLGYRSSELDKAEMSELIEFIIAWGTEHGVIFHDHDYEPATKDGLILRSGSPSPPQAAASVAERAPSEDEP